MNALVVSLSLALCSVTPDAKSPPNWSSFRNGGGSLATSKELPKEWNPQQGIAWQRELPGYGQSAPIVHNGQLYVTAVDGPHKEKLLMIAIDLATGETKWTFAHDSTFTKLASNFAVARAAPTPLADDRAVYAYFESGDVVALDHQGKLLWSRSLTKDYGEPDNHHGLGSSPAQTAESLFVNVQHRGPSYLVALDKATGQNKWKVERKSSQAWSSPIIVRIGESSRVVLSSGGTADAYDPATGNKTWEMGDVSGNSVPSPTQHGDKLFLGASLSDFDNASNAARSNCCIQLTDNGDWQVVWRADKALSDYASPVVTEKNVYYVNRAGVVYCLDRESGKERFARRLPGPCWATPVVANDRVYFFCKNGATVVLEDGDSFRELSQNLLWDAASPPKPEKYVETPGGVGHGPEAESKGPPADKGGGKRGGGLAAMLLKNDQNGDGKVSADELPEDMKRMLGGDKNQDGVLDAEEIAAMAEEFRKRRENSQQDSRDPIVYGVAVADNAIFVRTGTRLYRVGSK